MVWPAADAHRDLADPAVPKRERATFVHEMTHVWQAQRGVNLIAAKLKAGDSDASYRYDLINGPPFPQLNIEHYGIGHGFDDAVDGVILRIGGADDVAVARLLKAFDNPVAQNRGVFYQIDP